MLLTHKYRLNWQSLMEAFRASYRQARDEPAHYQAMSASACRQLQAFASVASVRAPLEAFLQRVIASHADQTRARPTRSLAE
jgi:hypothetical protein